MRISDVNNVCLRYSIRNDMEIIIKKDDEKL